jgi:hypothetical protein
MNSTILDITGIGPATAKLLSDSGIRNLSSLAKASVEKVSGIRGFTTARAEKTISAASALLERSEEGEPIKSKDKKPGNKDKARKKSQIKKKEKTRNKSRSKDKKKGKDQKKSKDKKKSKKDNKKGKKAKKNKNAKSKSKEKRKSKSGKNKKRKK